MNLYTKMKKAAGAVLAVAMGMTCIPTPLAVYAQEPEEYTVILEENFESELSAGVKLSGGVSVVEMDGNHVLEFNDTSDSETSKANIEIGKQAGEIVVEYKLYVVSDEGKSTIALTAGSKEESGSSSTSSAGEFLRFKTTGSDSRTYEFRGGDSQKTPSVKNGAYLCGKWIELKSVIDTATKTFDVYADGELLGENIAMSCKTENIVMESLDNISFLTGSKDKTHAYIDDVRVSLKTTDSGEGDGDGEDEKTPGALDCINFVAGGWKLQLPVESDTKPGSVLEKSPQELADGYTSKFFFADTDENGQDAVVFHCPVQGFKTGNTTYARSEMREMLDPENKTVNWTWQGTHTLVAEQRVTHVPANGKVITSQIHGIEQNGDNANPLVKVLYAYDKAKGTGSVIVYLKNTTEKTSADFAYAYPEVALGEKYRTEIQVVDGTAYVTIDTDDSEPMTVSHNFVAADPLWKDTWYYFKLGNYIQDSVDSSEEAYSDVWVYSSGISHSETVEKTPVESIRIDSSEIQLQPGERTSLSVTVNPIKAYNKAVTWDVLEGADVVAVDAKGYVTALKEGTAVVRATSVDNPIATSTCHVTVRQGEAVQAEELCSCDFGRESGLDLHTDFNTEFMKVIPESAEGTSVTLEQESEGNVIRFRDDSNNAPSKISFVFQPQTDTTTISFRVRIDALGEHKAGDLTFGCMYAVAAGSDSWYSNTTELFRVRNAAKGTLGNFSDLTYVLTNAYTPISLNADKVVGNYGDWVDVTYIITPNNGTAKANTTDVYMNGYLVGSGIANRNAIDYVNRLDIHSGTGDKMEFSIDDVKVYKGSKIPAEENVPTPQSLQLLYVPSVMGLQDAVKAYVQVEPAGSYDQVGYQVVSGNAVIVSQDGYITAVQEGKAVVRAYSLRDENVFDEAAIEVRAEQVMVRAESMQLKQTAMNLSRGKTAAIEAEVLPETASEKGVRYAIVSGPEIVTLHHDGTVTGKAVGTAKISVTSLDNPELVRYVTVSVTADFEPGQVIYQDSFDGSTLDSSHWSVSLAKAYTAVDVKDGVMTVEDGNGAAQPKAVLSFDPVSGTFSMQFRIKVENEAEIQGGVADTKYENLRIAFGNGTITSTSNEAFCIRSNGTNFTYNVSGSSYSPLTGEYHVSDWNTITLVTHVNADGTDTTDVYVNGQLLLQNAQNKVDFSVIDKMCFAADTAKYAKYSIDDLVIWAGDYDDAPTEEEKPTDPDDSSSNSSGSSSSDNSASSDTSSSSGSSDSGSGQNPDASDKPRPDRGQSASSQQPSAGSSTPQTGDAGEPALWGVVMLLSFAALAVTGVIAKRKEGQSKSDR